MSTFTSNIPMIFNSQSNFTDVSCRDLDASNVYIKESLYVDESLYCAQADIINSSSSTTLNVTQGGLGDVALFNADGNSLKIDSSGQSHFYKNVDISGEFKMSFNNVDKIHVASEINVKSNITMDSGYSFIGAGLVPVGGIIMWTSSTIPAGWELYNPDNFNNKFIIGSGSSFNISSHGGSSKISTNNLPSHSHSGTTSDSGGSHTHAVNQGKIDDKNFTNSTGQWPVGDGGSTSATVNSSWASPAHNHSTSNTATSGSSTATSGSSTEYYQPYYVLAYIIRVY